MPRRNRALNPVLLFGAGVIAGYILRGLMPTTIATQGYHQGVWYDDLAAKPIEHTIFGPFQNELEDPLAGVTPAGLTPPPMEVWPTIA